MTRRSRDRGSATIWLLAVGLMVLSSALLATTLGAALVAKHQARSAADLATLAGAMHAIYGERAACARAAQVAAANVSRQVACRLDGLEVTVTVQVSGPRGLPGPATASARAGPLRGDDSR